VDLHEEENGADDNQQPPEGDSFQKYHDHCSTAGG
jgi:hypothetical protein